MHTSEMWFGIEKTSERTFSMKVLCFALLSIFLQFYFPLKLVHFFLYDNPEALWFIASSMESLGFHGDILKWGALTSEPGPRALVLLPFPMSGVTVCESALLSWYFPPCQMRPHRCLPAPVCLILTRTL